MRVAPGDYISKDIYDANFEQSNARDLFLRACYEVNKKILKPFRDQVFPDFQEKYPSIGLSEEIRQNNKLHDLVKENLILCDWIVEAVVNALLNWARNQKALDLLEWNIRDTQFDYEYDFNKILDTDPFDDSYSWPLTTEEAKFTFFDAGYLPLFNRWIDFERRTRARFEAELIKYKNRVDAIANSHGLVPASGGKRSAGSQKHKKTEIPLAFIWLAKIVLRNSSYEEIAASYQPTEASKATISSDAVRKAVYDAARLVGIDLA